MCKPTTLPTLSSLRYDPTCLLTPHPGFFFTISGILPSIPSASISSNMTTFFDLPPELRLMVYGYAFRGRRIKFVRGLQRGPVTYKRARCANLLVSSKIIYLEARPLFFQIVRINPTSILDRKTGVLQCAESTSSGVTIGNPVIDPTLLQHVKIDQSILTSDGGKVFVKALKNLESLTYNCMDEYFIYDEFEGDLDIDDDDHSCCASCAMASAAERGVLSSIEFEVRDAHYKITGKCCDPDVLDGMNGREECYGDDPIRGFIGSWAWRDQPFRLLADVNFEGTMGLINMVRVSGLLDVSPC